ncbi:prolyl oligopeptidase family serine peptidase [Arcicella sp. LKC2W]|uniref:S9 family peptidase n=1 Tax=Arcicella sp. LKC2W TaxID=2984198 RepID=UPI002B1E92F7|nr:prolyl oligopeptidase family serine peptidase [Arcicella sp. LKC2W]MEA5458622.1 prolyl oligopeptidase family serine peptidase [Arcicella sp. LKC2W]
MRKNLLLILCLILSFSISAQKKKKKNKEVEVVVPIPKKVLTHDVYDSWKEIPDRMISNDGANVVYTLNPQEGDGRVVIHSLKSTKIDSVQRATDIRLTNDAEFAIFKIKPQLNLVKSMKRLKKKKDDMPKDSLGLYNLKSYSLAKVPNLISYKIPEKAGGWVAYQIEEVKKVDISKKKDSLVKNETKKKVSKKESEENGYRLVLKNLQTNANQIFSYVVEYDFTKYGKQLVFSTTGNDSTLFSGVYAYDLQSGNLINILKAKGKFKKITQSEDGQQIAFIADLDTNTKTQIRLPKLYIWKYGDEQAKLVADENQTFAPQSWLVSEHYQPRFSKDGTKLFFGTNPKPIIADTTLLSEEIVNVEVWNWQDKKLQTQQKVTLEEDKKRSYLAVLNVGNLKIVQLGFLEIPTVFLDKEANHNTVLAMSDVPYSNQHWDWNGKKDVYLVNLQDGSRKQIATALQGNPSLSPNAQYITWWSLPDTAWFAYSIKNEKTMKLTDNKTVKFYEEDDDHPDFPPAYGSAGWVDDLKDPMFVVYDNYDAWAIDLKNNTPMLITGGRENRVKYRYVNLDTDERFILGKNALWKLFYEKDKSEGFAIPTSPLVKPKEIYKESFSLSNPIKAKGADNLIFTKQNFQNYPDLYSSDLSFQNVKKISEANPQQKEYLWGKVELVDWKASDGTPLQGLLYKPEDFDSTKKYPMMVYFYEKNTDNLHTHFSPSPIRSYINYPYFTSNGYVIFVPDIVYKAGDPGKSAYNCIISGVESIIGKGFVNKDRIGVSGHSWGGYQTAYLVTQTNIFRAAEAGAPVANMTSAYGGIRWESGLSRQAQYERTQTRIGGTLWEKFDKYLDNSPLFQVPKVQTPVLMMHNDDDGAVPWYQGIEFYMALKRLNKPVWLLNYNGEKHGLTLRKNRKDFAKRLYQYFDHYLKDAPAPAWMTEGLPFMEKGINQKLEVGK